MPAMRGTFDHNLWVIRKRVLAFTAVFFAAGGALALLVFHVSDARQDPGPIVYLFPVLFAVVLGTYPLLTYLLNRWIRRLRVADCPRCGQFLWLSEYNAIVIALWPRCPRCGERLGSATGERCAPPPGLRD